MQILDINECELHKHNCSLNKERCINLLGSFKCICKQGFTGNLCEVGKSIDNSYSTIQKIILLLHVDVDECEMFRHACPTSSFCVNTHGSYHCECPNGTSLGLNGCRGLLT